MKKRIWAICLIVVMVVSLLAGCGGGSSGGGGATTSSGTAAPEKAVDLRMNITTAESGTWMIGAQYFADTVAEKTNGKYTVSIYANEQLSGGNQAKGVEMVQNGATDVDIHSTIIWSAVDQRLTVVNMPWLFTSYDEVDAVFSGEGGEAIMQIMREAGVVPLAYGEAGFRQLTNSKKDVVTPADLPGLKIRVPGIAMYIDLYQTLGADPTAINWGETFTALQQGAVDGQENPLDIIYTNKIHEVQDYLTMWNYSYDVLVFSVSQKTWDGLTDEEKVIFQEAATEAMALQKSEARKVNNDYLDELKKVMSVTELTAEQMQVFKDAAAPIYEQYEEIIGQDLYKAFGYEG